MDWEEIKESRFFNEFYFLAIALILAFGVINTSGTALNTDKPVVTVISCSMYPVYNTGDILLVDGVDYPEIETGDVIVYSVENSGLSTPIVHRVIEKNPEYLQTKGDNNPGQLEFESRVTPEQVHGRALFSIPRIGGLKLVAIDLLGYSGGSPLVLDEYQYLCTPRT